MRNPQQQRSIESTARMLDAAEELLADGGPDALTVDAVVSRANSSVGSFYARFGDRQGLLLAVQDRFLDRVEAAAIAQASTLVAVDDLREVIEQLVTAFLEVFRSNRNAFNAILVQSLSIQSFRDRGALASQQGARAVTEILGACGAQVTHPDPALAADFTFRTMFALATHIVMMEEGEVTGVVMEPQQWIDQTADMLHLYLGADRSR